jgi:hypothetical protein
MRRPDYIYSKFRRSHWHGCQFEISTAENHLESVDRCVANAFLMLAQDLINLAKSIPPPNLVSAFCFPLETPKTSNLTTPSSNRSLTSLAMPDISMLSRKHTRSPTPQESSESSSSEEEEEEESTEPLVVPDACLACGKEKVTHITVPCRHPCLCRACAMKMATGGRCKVASKLCK